MRHGLAVVVVVLLRAVVGAMFTAGAEAKVVAGHRAVAAAVARARLRMTMALMSLLLMILMMTA
eukprot:40664-Chlamydomonas_euryale.AAC.1